MKLMVTNKNFYPKNCPVMIILESLILGGTHKIVHDERMLRGETCMIALTLHIIES